jgi:hypothetical protein
MFRNAILEFFGAKDPFKTDNMQQKPFLQNLNLLIVKNHLPIQFVKSTWLMFFAMHLCSKIMFLF